MSNVNKTLQEFSRQISEDFPVLREILQRAESGDLTQEEALAEMAEAVMKDPELARKFQETAMSSLAPLQEHEMAIPQDGSVVQTKHGSVRINPLHEAALIERAQFDEDMPEIRTGGPVPGVPEAIRIGNAPKSPQALGMMLQATSEDTKPSKELVVPSELGGSLKIWELILPTGKELLALPQEERQVIYWLAMGTTHGRDSLTQHVRDVVFIKLSDKCPNLQVSHKAPDGVLLYQKTWTVHMDGPNSLDVNFNPVTIAGNAIGQGLLSQIENPERSCVLYISSFNAYAERMFGWVGKIYSTDKEIKHDV